MYLTKQKEIGYTIPIVCWFCCHSQFDNPDANWGRCKFHLDKTQPQPMMLIYRYGRCPDKEITPESLESVDFATALSEFFEE